MRELAKRLCRAGPLLAALSAMPAAAATPGQGEAVLNRQTLSLALANNLATAALDACRAIGHTAVVAVVDRGGNLVALQRGDDVGPHNTAAAQRKAFTALSSKTPTILLAERARNDPSSRNLNTLGELLLLGGGVPVLAADQVIGAVGVAGAGGSVNDDGCATKAVQAVSPEGTAQR
jgi:uncharacterized protein GlcG (DUF336 family)